MLLNLKQIGDFKRDGFLILRSFIENKTIDQWRKQFWKQVGGCYSDKSSWSTASSTNNPKLTPGLGSLPKIEAIVGPSPSNLRFNLKPSQRARLTKNVEISSLFQVRSIFSARMVVENYNIFSNCEIG